MGMILLDESKCFEEYGKVTYSTWNWAASKLKKAWDLMIAFSPVLWILFFLMLTVLVNFFVGVI